MRRTAIALMLLAAVVGVTFAQGKKYEIVLGTAGTSGTYYVVAAAMAQAINKVSDKITIVAQPTKGSIENINLVNSGAIQMGMSNADGVYWSSTGTGMYAKSGALNLKAVMSMYMSAGHLVTKAESNIKTIADLKGKKVCLGPPGQTVVEMSKAFLLAYGIDPLKDIKPFYLAIDEGLDKLKDGEIDATFWVAGVPTAGLINAASTANIRFVEVSDAVLAKISEESPYYARYTIPANTYKGQTAPVQTLKIMTELFASSKVPEDVVYEFVKLAVELQPQYVSSHVVIKEINAQTAASIVSPLHPGALKYYKEKGLR